MRPAPLLAVLSALALTACGTTTKTEIEITPTTGTAATTPSTTTTHAATTTATTAPVNTTPPPPKATPVFFRGAVGGAAERPATLELTGDGTLSVEKMQWGSWGGATASGTGDAIYHGCNPNCAEAQVHSALVTVRMFGVRSCGGRRYYSGVSLILNSGRLLDRKFLEQSWSPC